MANVNVDVSVNGADETKFTTDSLVTHSSPFEAIAGTRYTGTDIFLIGWQLPSGKP